MVDARVFVLLQVGKLVLSNVHHRCGWYLDEVGKRFVERTVVSWDVVLFGVAKFEIPGLKTRRSWQRHFSRNSGICSMCQKGVEPQRKLSQKDYLHLFQSRKFRITNNRHLESHRASSNFMTFRTPNETRKAILFGF